MEEPIIAHLLVNDRFSTDRMIIDITESNLSDAYHKQATLSSLFAFKFIPVKESPYD